MRADPEDITSHISQRSRFPIVELLIALALVIGLAVFWFWSDEKKPAETETVATIPPVVVPAQPPELPATPDIPEREEAVAATDVAAVSASTNAVDQSQPQTATPLSPEDGDKLLRKQLSASGTDTILNNLAKSEHPLDLTAALVDGLGRGIILRKMLPIGPPQQAFSVDRRGDALFMSATSFNRYDRFTDAVTALDTGSLVETFHKLRPLYKRAYEQLGLDPEDFDNALIRTLDLVLATPEISEPIALNTKSVVYVFTDPKLENLTALQKQLLRMGPDNLRRIKQQARVLREGLLAQ